MAHNKRVHSSDIFQCFVSYTDLITMANIQRVDTWDISEGFVCYSRLVAPTHMKCMDPGQMFEGIISNTGLIATAHHEGVDSPKSVFVKGDFLKKNNETIYLRWMKPASVIPDWLHENM